MYQPDLFNTEVYHRLHTDRFGAAIRHEYRRGRQGELAGAFQAVLLRPGVWVSPGRAPYGGFDTAAELDDGEFTEFVRQVETDLRGAGADRLELTLPPLCYSPRHGSERLPILCRLGYCVTRQELNQSIALGDASVVPGNYAHRKCLAKAARLGLTLRELLDVAEQRDGYDTIAENRHRKGRVLSMTWGDVEAMLDAVPRRLRLFGAEHEGRIVAAAVCIAINQQVFYVHAWGDRTGAAQLSPMNALAAHIGAVARREGFTLLDLGTSSVDGVVDPGLMRFKRSLGASPSLKLWLGKSFA